MKTLFQQVQEMGIEYSNHLSDLYIPVNEQTEKLVSNYEFKQSVKIFTNNIDKKSWYDIPFAYAPYWENRKKENVK